MSLLSLIEPRNAELSEEAEESISNCGKLAPIKYVLQFYIVLNIECERGSLFGDYRCLLLLDQNVQYLEQKTQRCASRCTVAQIASEVSFVDVRITKAMAQHDEVVWQVINQGFCSFKIK